MKRRLILVGLVFLAGVAYGAAEEFMACRFESAL